MSNSCQFCREFETGKIEIKTKDTKLKIDRVILPSENFLIFPSLGQIVEGYLLIVPKEHYISVAQIPNKHYNELREVQEKVRRVLTKHYSKPIFFEHGPLSKQERAGCCVEHAHLHAVPTKARLLDEITKHFQYRKIKNFSELPTKTAYLFLEENNEKYVFPIKEVIPPQYLRQVLAAKLGVPEKWDWREYLGIEELQNTIRKLKNHHTFLNNPNKDYKCK